MLQFLLYTTFQQMYCRMISLNTIISNLSTHGEPDRGQQLTRSFPSRIINAYVNCASGGGEPGNEASVHGGRHDRFQH